MTRSLKRKLNVKDMARISGYSDEFLKDCIDLGVIPENAYSETEIAYGGKTKEEEMKRHLEICRAKDEGKPWNVERKVQSAEERFTEWLSLPRGHQRLRDPRTKEAIFNAKHDLPIWYQGKTKRRMIDDGDKLD